MNNPLRHGWRLLTISTTLRRYRLDQLVNISSWFRPLIWLIPGRRDNRSLARGQRLRLALQELGPVFVKFGQVLSTRRDLLPSDIADELAKLQDAVAPFPGTQARAIIEAELQQDIDDVFLNFEEQPLASASIAQVHAAELKDGKSVVVKVVRPAIEQSISRDVALLKTLARLAQRYHPEGRRIRPVDVVQEFETYIFDELDMQREAANASLLRRYHQNSRDVYIPEVYWSYCKQRVLVMERVYGIPIKDKPALVKHGVNLERLAIRCVRLFYTQVFRDNLFHADMHPGNILVAKDNPDDPQVIALDFGIVASLSNKDLYYIGENFLAIFSQQYRRVAELHVEAGWVPADTRLDEMEASIRTVCESSFTRPLSEISFGEMLMKLFQAARRFKLTIQPQLIMLQKTLLNIEGLGRDLYPDLDLWAVAKPELESIVRSKRSPVATFKAIRKRLPLLLERTPDMPELIHRTLKKAAAGELTTQLQHPALEQLPENLRQLRRSITGGVLAGSLLICGTVLLVHPVGPDIFDLPILSLASWLGAVVAFLTTR